MPRCSNGHRRFHRNGLEWLAGLVMLRGTEMPIAEVRDVAALSWNPGSEAERFKAFEAHRETVVPQLKRTQEHLAALDTKIAAYRAYVAGEEETIHNEQPPAGA